MADSGIAFDPAAHGPQGVTLPAIDFSCAPLRGLDAAGEGLWLATDQDPQFHIELPQPQPPGFYLFTVTLRGAHVTSPCVYLDLGHGWCEESRFPLVREKDGECWSALVALPEWSHSVRFDPTESEGYLYFAGATVQPLSASDALLRLLDYEPASDPVRIISALRLLARAGESTDSAALARALIADRAQIPPATPAPVPGTYADWVMRHGTPGEAQLQGLRAAAASMPSRPLLSLLLPSTGLHPARLEALVDSLVAQCYPQWELWLLAGRETPDEILAAIARQRTRDGRVRVIRAAEVAGAAEAPDDAALLAHALGAADATFAAVIDDHAQFAPHALLMLVDEALRSERAQVLYADEDCIDARGDRVDPFFKPEWDPILALGQDYLGPLVLCRMDRLRPACDRALAAGRATRCALALHCTSGLSSAEVVRVPHVLSHVTDRVRRPERTASEGFVRDIERYLAAAHPDARLTIDAGVPRSRHALPSPLPKVSIVIPTRDRSDLLRRCIDSILGRSTYPNFEILIVDNESSEPESLAYFEEAQSDLRVRVIAYDKPFNYSAINNFAVERTDGEVVALLNNDVEVITAGWIEEMLPYALRPDVGAVGAMLYYPDDTIQHAGVVIGLGGVAGHAYTHQPCGFAGQRGRARQAQRMGAVTAACLLVRREAYLEVGGLDESLAVAFNDVDFCLRLAQRGLHNVWTPFAELYHHESASRGVEDTPEKQSRFAAEVQVMIARWRDALQRDPAYHPNLSLAFASAFELADAPRAPLSDWIEEIIARAVVQ